MEKVNIKNSRKLNLVGDLYTADSDKIIIMSHGFGYDRHEKENKFDTLANSFNKVGYNVITFDFSGVGESDDDSLSPSKQADDLKSVIKFARDKEYKNIILFGVSLGTLAIFNAYDEDIKAIVGVGAVTDKGDSNWRTNKFTKEQLKEFKGTGQLVFYTASGPREHIILDRQYLLEREEVNQKLLLRNIKCPVLLIHAPEDEWIPIKISKKAVEILGNKGELYILKGAVHNFLQHIDIVANKTINWLAKKV